MRRACWWLVERLANALEPEEREAALGDIVESGESCWRALRDVFEFVARRQVSRWKQFRPWLAVVVAIPAGLLLSLTSEWLANGFNLNLWLLRNYRDFDPALLAENHLSVLSAAHGLARVVQATVAVLAWAWSCGFVLGALSRRATPLAGILFCGLILLEPIAFAVRRGYAGAEVCVVMGAVWACTLWGLRLGGRGMIQGENG